ncbi:serine/threonine-protein kinase [Streptomyces sp. NPDC057245]|uniref:serine/threonine-protein kinase n=1 Tax=Streptomyces TaxID=1883 RepID=UPI001C1E8D2A|nr:serine/threonine-protein kinase [Streptomyces sp. A108]MBU6530809.1 serine/threonine protein kinase [Streptomyces sp. A108]
MTAAPGPDHTLRASDPVQIGPYRLLGRLGSGGMGRVYLGRSMTGQLAAVKVLHDHLAEDQLFRSRFVRELDVASRISGRFSAAVLGSSGLRDQHLWLATEYVPGPSVLEAVEASGPFDTQTVLALCLGLLGALETIHSAGVIHRDLKPSNVLLAADGPRVIDFGISAAVDTTRLTMTNVAVGTPGYMSPELVRGVTEVGPASDVFALGCTLAFAATGVSPFMGANAVETVFRILREDPDLPGLPEEIGALVEPCLRKEPEHRPSIDALIKTLPAAETDRISRLLAHGQWLPAHIQRQTLEHEGRALAWDGARQSSPQTVLQDWPLPTDDDTRSLFATDDETRSLSAPHAATLDESQPTDRSTVVLNGNAQPPSPPILPAPPSLGAFGPPPSSGPPYAPGTADPDEPESGPMDEMSVRTHMALLSADTPPLPRIPRRGWFRWVPAFRGKVRK